MTYGGASGFGAYGLSWYVAVDFRSPGDGLGMIGTYDLSTGTNFRPHRIAITDATDGASNTIMVAERIPSIAGSYSDLFWGWWDYPTTYDTRTPARATSGLYYTSGSGSGNTACVYPSPMLAADLKSQCVFNAPSSFHTGGANFAMGDGSVRFISINGANSTFAGPTGTMTILEALGSRAGGETFNMP